MSRVFQFLGLFLLAALVAHLAYVLLLPPMAAKAIIHDLRRELGENSFQPLSGEKLWRIVRHPVPEAAYGGCVLRLDERPVVLTGPDLRSLWTITVYSPRGDVVYAVNDRLVPEGGLRIRFEYRELDADVGEIALPKLENRTLVLPLQQDSVLMLLEVWPWHPGQTMLVQGLMKRLQCRAIAARRPLRPQKDAVVQKVPLPRPRPQRRAGAP